MVKHAKIGDGSGVTFGRNLVPVTAQKHMCDTLREGVKNSRIMTSKGKFAKKLSLLVEF